MNVRQVLTMARYEVLMAFRRRSLVILLILFLVALTFFANVSRETSQTSVMALPQADGSVVTYDDLNALPDAAVPEWMRGVDLNLWYRSGGVSTAMIAGAVIVVIAIVMFTNESIPLDRQYRVRELLDALPLSRASYLIGKVLGVWTGLLAISIVAALFSAVVFRLFLGAYDGRFLALLWLFFELPLVLLAGALAVLLTSWARSRRGAVLWSLLVLPVAIILVALAIPSLSAVGVYIHPAYAFYVLLTPDQGSVAIVTERIVNTIPIMLGALIVSWALAYGWQRLREGN